MPKILRPIGVLSLLLIIIFAARLVEAGGWAVMTLESLPEAVIEGEPVTVRFTLRQHGQHLVSVLDGSVTAQHLESGETVNFEVQTSDRNGTYQATMVLPKPGTWQWFISSSFGDHPMPELEVAEKHALVSAAATQSTIEAFRPLSPWRIAGFIALGIGCLLLIVGWRRRARLVEGLAVAILIAAALAGVVAPSDPAASAESLEAEIAKGSLPADKTATVEQTDLAALGADLFVAKGCITCHQNRRIEGIKSHIAIGPNLSQYSNDPDFLRRWLSDPAQIRPNTIMPDLELSPAEIEALITFLNET